MPTANALSALVHDRLGQTLRDVFARAGTGNPGSLFEIRLEQNDTLVRQLEDGSDGPPRVTLGFALGIIGNAVPALPELGGQNRLDPGDLVRRLQSAVRERARCGRGWSSSVACATRSPASWRPTIP
jgi:hypothetical protein